MKSKSGADLSRMSSALSTFLSNQIFVLHFCLLNFETVPVKGFLLVNTRTFQNNPVTKVSNRNAKCVYKQKVFLLWVLLTLENKTFCSTWLLFADRSSTYQGTCSTWVIFSDKLSPCREIEGILITLSDVPSKHERNDRQLLLWLVFPFKVSLAFYGWSFLLWNFLEFSRNWRFPYIITWCKIFTLVSFALLQSSG